MAAADLTLTEGHGAPLSTTSTPNFASIHFSLFSFLFFALFHYITICDRVPVLLEFE